MSASIKSHSVGATMVLTISNPEQRNALGPEMYAAAVEALNVAASSPDVRSVVIVGEGSHFCAGGNLQRLLGNRQQPTEVQDQTIEGLHSWIETVHTFPKPVIAAVEGACAGAGFSLTLACDFIVAARDAIFVMAYSSVAISPDGGGSWSLARALPRATVMQMLMAAERLTPERLHQLGVINQVSESGEALAQALTLAEKLNGRAPNVLASIKELVNDAAASALPAHLAAERQHFVRNLHHPNGGEGISAFLEKRPAVYR